MHELQNSGFPTDQIKKLIGETESLCILINRNDDMNSSEEKKLRLRNLDAVFLDQEGVDYPELKGLATTVIVLT